MKEDHDYIETKRTAIKANFINFKIGEENTKHHNPSKLQTEDAGRAVAPKYLRLDGSTPKGKPKKKARLEYILQIGHFR